MGTSFTSWMACSTEPIIIILKPFFKFKDVKLWSSDGALPEKYKMETISWNRGNSVCKFVDFSVIQILREINLDRSNQKGSKNQRVLKFPATEILRQINFRDFRCPKAAILTYSEALNFDFSWIFAFSEGRNSLTSKIWSPYKWHFMNFYVLPHWFHVKSDWKKNSEISKLCELHFVNVW